MPESETMKVGTVWQTMTFERPCIVLVAGLWCPARERVK